MKRFILSAFSVVLATSAVTLEASALPKGDPSFNLQARRLSELDTRNKSDFKLQTVRLTELDARNKSDFKLQTLRLSEFDARNKSDYGEDSDYVYPQSTEQTTEWTAPQNEAAEDAEPVMAETVTVEVTEVVSEQSPSLTERRLESLDRS